MAKEFKVTWVVRMQNAFASAMLNWGMKMGPMVLLTVAGRKSGLPRSTPVAVLERDGKRWIIGSYGAVNWVKNLRAEGKGTIKRGGKTEEIRVVELGPKEAAPVLRDVLGVGIAGVFTRGYYDVTKDSTLEEIEMEAYKHPVFLVESQG
ncbi:MAG: nitroreductase family deazaflavin-dependent oxidoreductase [Chloroflexia bacterium]